MRRSLTALLALAPLTACSAPTACPANPNSFENVRNSSAVSGMAELSDAGQTTEVVLQAHFDHLPRLWPSNGAISDAQLYLGVSTRYASDPLGGDGKTQMPQVSAKVDGILNGRTSSFPGANGDSFSTQFVAQCPDDSRVDCCAFGATECDRVLRVLLTRVDGEPFPPVQLSWSAAASVVLYGCPGSADGATFTLSSEAP